MAVQESLTIDPEKVTKIIIDFIREKVDREKKDGVILGLSGGIDSVVLTALAAKAVGSSKVYAYYLFDRSSQKKFQEYAQELANELKINFEMEDITKLSIERGAYKSPIIKLIGFSSVFNKIFLSLARLIYRFILKEDHLSLTLKRRDLEKAKLTKVLYKPIIQDGEDSFSVRHILRREILERYATEKNLLLIGAANRTEFLIGWFIQDGIDDLPIEPLLGLYKTHVRQLAAFLNISQKIINELPATDMIKGISDEYIIGISYEKIDRVLYLLEKGFDRETIINKGISPVEYDKIKAFNQLSNWKRVNKHEFPNCEAGLI